MKILVKRVIPMLVCIACAVSMLGGCSKKASSGEGKDENFDYSIAVYTTGASYSNLDSDPLYKEFCDKFNIEFDVTELPANAFSEKVRLMLASGTTTDVMQSPFSFSEYVKNASQGLIAPLPDGWETKYPNLAWTIQSSGIKDFLEKTEDGKVYGIPRTLSIFKQEDEASENSSEQVNIDTYALLYRKDWAKKLGIELEPLVEYDEFMDAVLKMKNADFHESKEDIIGISVAYDEAPNLFVTSHNSYYQKFHKVDGKYVFGLDEPSTIEGMKAYKKAYQDGILHPNFYAHKDLDALDRFISGQAVAHFSGVGSLATFGNRVKSFQEAHPDMNAEEAVGLTFVKAPDGKTHGWEGANQWTTWYLNPEMSEAKTDRILQVFDYITSKEGFRNWNAGVEGVDYTLENGEFELLSWEKQEDGSYVSDNTYVMTPILNWMSAEQHLSVPFLRYSDYVTNSVTALREAKLAGDLSIAMIDYNVQYFTGEKYKNFMANFDVNAMMAEVVVSDGDLEKEWAAKVAGIRGILDPALEEINAELAGN